MRRISSHILLTPQGLLPDRVVTLSDDGTITGIDRVEHIDREAGVEFFAGILIPGLFNAHCHLELSHLRGAIPAGGGFTAFARGMRKAKAQADAGVEVAEFSGLARGFVARDEHIGRSRAAEFWDAKMWSEGVSAVGDICNGASTFGMKRHSRIKYHNFCELFGLGADPARAFALCDEALGAGSEASVTPHSTYSLNRDAFSAAVGGNDNRPLSIHFMESEQEIDLFRRKGPLWDWYSEQGLKPDFLDYGSPAERLTAQVPPDRPVMLVHNCCVSQRDIDIVMGHFTAPVTWVLCPASNRHISGFVPPVGLLRKNGLRIAVGTDSPASNDTLSMVREMRLLGDVPLAELLGWAVSGTVETGRAPGFVLLSGVDMQTLTLGENARAQRII